MTELPVGKKGFVVGAFGKLTPGREKVGAVTGPDVETGVETKGRALLPITPAALTGAATVCAA